MKVYDALRLAFVFGVFGLAFTSCRPSKRLERLQKMHPELFQTSVIDSFSYVAGKTKDTLFFFSKERDTIRTENATVYRYNDTIRLVSRCPGCTTFIRQNTVQPIKETLVKIPDYEIMDKMLWVVFGILSIMIVRVFFTKKQQ